MNRVIRALVGFILGVFLGGASVVAFAQSIPPTYGDWKHGYNGSTATYPSAVDAAQALVAAVNAAQGTQHVFCSLVHDSDYEKGVVTAYQDCFHTQSRIWTVSRFRSCPSGYTLDSQANVCNPLPQCPAAGSVQSSGWFLMGNSPTANFPGVTCAGQCLVSFSGYAPAGQAIQNGVNQYYARGSWQYLGASNTCSGGSATPVAQSSLPPDTCGPNQYYGTINGKPVCIDATTGQPANTSPAPPSTTTTQTDNTTNPDGSTTKTTTTTNPDGSTTTTTTTTQPNGNSTTTTTTTPPPGEDQTDDFCKKNPDNPMCQEIESGSPAGTNDLYTPESRTVGNVLSDFRAKVQNAPFYSGASNFFNISVPGGACGGMNAQIAVGWGQSFNIDIDSVLCGSTAQLVYSVLGIGIMLAAAWVAFRIAIL